MVSLYAIMSCMCAPCRHSGSRPRVLVRHAGPGSETVSSQLLPLPSHTSELWQAAGNSDVLKDLHQSTAQLAINAEIPALGHTVYRVQASSQANTMGATHAAASAAASTAAAAAATSTIKPGATTDNANASTTDTRSGISNAVNVGNEGILVLSNGVLEVTVDSSGIQAVKMLSTGQSRQYSSTLVQYKSRAGPSGAYLFGIGRESEVSS